MQFNQKQIINSFIAIALLTALSVSTAAQAKSFMAIGGQNHLWLVKQNTKAAQLTIYQRAVSSPADPVLKVATLHGQLAENGIAAGHNQLVLIYSNGAVQEITVTHPSKQSQKPDHFQYRFDSITPLPGNLHLNSVALVNGHLWVLAKNKPEKKPDDRDAPRTKIKQQDSIQLNHALGLPPTVPIDKSDTKTESNHTKKTNQPSPPAAPKIRLLKQSAGQWQQIALPAKWNDKGQGQLVAGQSQEPVLINRAGDTLAIYNSNASQQWEKTQIGIEGKGGLTPLVIDKQLVIAQFLPAANQKNNSDQNKIGISIFVIRDGKKIHTGKLYLSKIPAGHTAAVAASGVSVALLSAPGKLTAKAPLAWYASSNLQGQVTQKTIPLHEAKPPPHVMKTGEYLVWFIILVMAGLVMFLFWRRDLRNQQVKLPDHTELAGLGRRAVAGFIDLAPIVVVIAYAYHIGPLELFAKHWPGETEAQSLQNMIPGLLVIGVFVVYTAAGELLFQQTIGKWITGLRVTDLNGQKPSWWRLVVRCLLKTVDLVAWILLIFPALNPAKQRLGDMIAGTVVVGKKNKK